VVFYLGSNLLYSLMLLIIPVGWLVIRSYLKLSLYRQVYELENSFEVELDEVHLTKNILRRVMKETKASAGIIYWFDEIRNKFKLKSIQGIPTDQLNQITQLLIRKAGLLEQIYNEQRGFLIRNIATHPLTSGNAANELAKLYISILGLPLNANQKTIGILVIIKKNSSFGKRDQLLLDLFAPRVAINLDHSRLYRLASDTALENAKLYVNISKLYHKVVLDGLTGLYNRHFLMQRLKEEIKKAYRFKQPLSLIFTDIDLFKQINDQYGHSSGDQVLIEFGDLLKKSIREFDLACRFGGEEFVILLPQTDPDNAFLLAERLREKTAATFFCMGSIRARISASFGISSLVNTDKISNLDDDALNKIGENLLTWADEALYRAKKAGRNKVITYEHSKNH
jgi:diguanylate cyclase (GGDEF)-like protein